MKLRTSFFNPAVLKKNITRFAPVWGLYAVFSLLHLLTLYSEDFRSIENTFQSMGVINFLYGGICALVLFGDLFKARLCNALHAMPMRREGWFLTHLTAGMLFCLAPNLLCAVLGAVLMEQVCYVAFLWLAVMVLQFLFFFGVSAFAAMCAGNRLGAAAVYALVNFLAVLVAWLVDTFYAPALYGVVLDLSGFSWFCPVLRFSQSNFLQITVGKYTGMEVTQVFWQQWWYLGATALSGLAFLALALLVYRKRKLETAGDLISLKPVSPVFLVLYTLSVGAVFYLTAELFGADVEYVFLVVGLLVGFFTGWMLLEKRIKVFGKKRFLQLAIFLVVFFGTIGITWLDPVGIARYIPETETIQSVNISPYSAESLITSFVEDDYFYYQRGGITLTEPTDIENILGVHRYCIEKVDDSQPVLSGDKYDIYTAEGSRTPLTITYTLKNGKTVQRCYKFAAASEVGKTLKPYFSAVSYVLGTENSHQLLQRVENMEYYSHDTKDKALRFEAGKRNDARIEDVGSSYEVSSISYHVAGTMDNSPEAAGLFQAIVADCNEGTLAQLWDYHGDVAGSLSIQYRDENNVMQYMDITVYTDSTNTVACLKQLMDK